MAEPLPTACDIEIIERVHGVEDVAELTEERSILAPNEIRINGQRVPTPAGHPVIVHPINSRDDSDRVVKVTLTVFARTVSIRPELDNESSN
ncbi:hypothetical protein IU449_27160 [Nocardia higoensis]|uniref:Uncharacterized protein n=1 Tax=Nocardia higoensis TaxID=228599 RepID=A0ABS0DI92_9NOCA|nr:hypothetical protein [Nocardia higoensis]MBF6358180.1 hypothetical protein [Nocardia higoensis]